MSNVSPSEIVELVARIWNVTRADMAALAPSWQQNRDPLATSGYSARCAALLLMCRHTLCGPQAMTRALGMRSLCGERVALAADRFQVYAARHLEVQRKLDEAEKAIDELHERNMALGNSQLQKFVRFQPVSRFS